MTTTPNDAAVNAESAAKLVNEIPVHCNFGDGKHPEWADAISAGVSVWLHSRGASIGDRRVIIDLFNAMLSRAPTATPQTQATHGEGEAVAGECVYKNAPTRCYRVRCHMSNECADDDLSFRVNPAPSPTASPALGDKELCALIKGLSEGADLIDEIPIIIGPAISDYMRQAAAALSGVAAQGDGEARVSEDARDARRYRWLRDKCDTSTGFLLCQRRESDEWDEEIDAALGVADQGPNIDLPRQG